MATAAATGTTLVGAAVLVAAAIAWRVTGAGDGPRAAVLGEGTQTNTRTKSELTNKADLIWDLSDGHALSAVGWPRGRADGGPWYPPAPGRVQIALPGGRRASYRYEQLQVWQEAGRVRALIVFFEGESLEAACDRAAALLTEWGLAGHESLQTWHQNTRRLTSGQIARKGVDRNWSARGDRRARPRYEAEIGYTHWQPRPWSVSWSVYF